MTRKARIEQVINQHINPLYLLIEDESSNHHVPLNAQTHFKIIAVAAIFEDQKPIARHRVLNKLLEQEFQQGLHALSMHLFTPKEWDIKNQNVASSPNCRDGYKNV